MDIPRPPKSNRRRNLTIAAAAVVVTATTVALANLKPAAPTVERSTALIDGVRRGLLLRQVRGPGTLVPEQIRWITAVTAGRVERVLVQPGAQVKAETVLLELSNPDEELQALNEQQRLIQSEADLTSLRTRLETDRLNQEAAVATVRATYQEAKRQFETSQALAQQQLITPNEWGQIKDQIQLQETRLRVEERRLEILTEAQASQIRAQESQVEGLRSMVQFRRNRIASMRVRAGSDGVVQQLGGGQLATIEPGQWVQSGMTLARVVQPERLKAVLRIPETQAKDVTLGLKAAIDTRNGIVPGHVVRIDPGSQGGTVGVDVALDGELPAGARPDLSVDGTIEIDRLENVLFVGRPAFGQSESQVSLFKLEPNSGEATRVPVRLGRSSVNTIEIVEGLQEGDSIIISDLSRWDGFDRVRLK